MPSTSAGTDRPIPGCDGQWANEIEQLGRCRRPDSPGPARPIDGSRTLVQTSVSAADCTELSVCQLREALAAGRQRVPCASPPDSQRLSKHVGLSRPRIPDPARPLIEPNAQPCCMCRIGEVRPIADSFSGRIKRQVKPELAVLRKYAAQRGQCGRRERLTNHAGQSASTAARSRPLCPLEHNVWSARHVRAGRQASCHSRRYSAGSAGAGR